MRRRMSVRPGFGSGCWSLCTVSALPPLLLLLLVVVEVPLRAQADVVHVSESSSGINVTSSPAGGKTETDETKSTHMLLIPGDKSEGSGLQEEEPVSTTIPPEEPATIGKAVDISADSAETENLLPSQTSRGHVEKKPTTLSMPTDYPWHVQETKTETTVFDLDTNKDLWESHTDPSTPSPSHPPSSTEILTVKFFNSKSHDDTFVSLSPDPKEVQGHDVTTLGFIENDVTTYTETMAPETESTTTEMYVDDLSTSPSPFVPRTYRPYMVNTPRKEDPFMNKKEDPIWVAPKVPPMKKGPPVRDPVSREVECRLGMVRINDTCRSHCEIIPNYCFNGGQCFVLEGTGVFCRCNIQDYVWHKGSRCEAVITEFQVMCIAIGSSALTVLLLFMIVVCFAKKLHLLKTENNKLRKRSSKYRQSSEQHNDNFSLSTIAEGSNPNKTMSRYTWETKQEPSCEDDPNAQNKLEDAVKSPPPKEDESLNIQNSLTPKHENHKTLGEENSSEVNSLQNNMM